MFRNNRDLLDRLEQRVETVINVTYMMVLQAFQHVGRLSSLPYITAVTLS